MMRCGLAEQTGATPRVLLFAVATARDTTEPVEFAAVRSIPAGISSRSSFFDEPDLFGVYLLEHDQIDDGGTIVRTLRLRQRPGDGDTYGYSPTSAMLLGLTKVEFEALVARGGAMSQHFRAMKLDSKQSIVDPNGRPYDRYRIGIQGLNVNNASTRPTCPSTRSGLHRRRPALRLAGLRRRRAAGRRSTCATSRRPLACGSGRSASAASPRSTWPRARSPSVHSTGDVRSCRA